MNAVVRVCVVMPAYSAAETLARAAASVLTQRVDSLVLAVSVYPGDEPTKAVARTLADPRVVIVERDGRGISNGRNCAIRSVAAERYMFLDSDDAYAEETVARYLDDCDRHPSPALRYADWMGISPLDGSVRRRYVYAPRRWPWEQLLLQNFIATGTVMVEREILDECGMFDERYPHAEDWDLWLRIARRYPLRHLSFAASFHTRSKMSRLYSRDFFLNEAVIARAHAGRSEIGVLAVALARGRYGAYYVGTLRSRLSLSLLAQIRPADLLLAPVAIAVRLYRQAAGRLAAARGR